MLLQSRLERVSDKRQRNVLGAVENIFYIQAYNAFFLWLRPILTTGGHGVYAAIWGALYSRYVYPSNVGSDPGACGAVQAFLAVPLEATVHRLDNTAACEQSFLPSYFAKRAV